MEEFPESKDCETSKSETAEEKNQNRRRNRAAPVGPVLAAGKVAGTVQPRRNQSKRREVPRKQPVLELPGNPRIISREEHNISRKNIDSDALKVMRRLIGHGFNAFLVGGGVRDLLLEKQPKDFDIGTDASPEEVRALFRNSRTIGRRFKIVHVYFRGNKIMEVATFRASSADDEEEEEEEGNNSLGDNTYGDPATDALRRDLTINGLFYDLRNFSIIDYVGGLDDLKSKTIRIIGEPVTRILEDPVRMIRAVRHAARANFSIEPKTFEAICEYSTSLKEAAKPRIYEELLRDLRGGASHVSFNLFAQTGLLENLLPELATAYKEDPRAVAENLEQTLQTIDQFVVRSSRELPSAVLLLALMIGNLSKARLNELSEDTKLQRYAAFWHIGVENSLVENSEGEEQDEEEITLPAAEKAGIRTRRSRNRTPTSRLGDFITRVFTDFGVTRRDREQMERLLKARYAMIVGGSSKIRRELISKPYFADAYLLLRCTAHNEVAQERAEFWAQYLSKHKTAAQKKAPRKTRNGRKRPSR